MPWFKTVLALTLLAVSGCAPRRREALDAQLRRYNAFVGRQAGDSIAAMYAADGELAAPGRSPITGAAAIAAFLATFTAVHVDSSAMWADSVVVTDSGSVQWGHYYQRATVASRAPVTVTGGFVALWRREAAGWRLRRMRTY